MLTCELSKKQCVEHDAIDYVQIIQNLTEGLVVLHNGCIIFANTSFAHIMGCNSEELTGRIFPELFPITERETLQLNYENILKIQENSNSHEFSIARKSETMHIKLTLSMLESKESALVLATVTDITDKRERIDKIKKLNDRLESILHSMHDVIISFGAVDGRILSINPAAEQLFGIPLRALSNGNEDRLFERVHPDDQEKVRDFYQTVREMEFNELEYRIIRSDKKIRWVRDKGYVVYCKSRDQHRIDHIIHDITEQKQAIQELYRSEKKYKDFFHKTKDMAFSVSPDGIFLDINDAGIELLGLPNRKTALQSNVLDFTEHHSTIDDIMSELNKKDHISNKYITLKSNSGALIEVDITARAKKDGFGEILYYEGIASNITQALENQRNRVLRNTASGMCHYLNSHLMHISSAQDGMEEELSEIDEKFINSSRPEEKDEIWFIGRNVLNGYVQDINLAYKKISEITRAFNSAFLKYREEAYLDKTILDIFSAYREDSTS